MWKRATLVAAVGTAALASGCAEEREPINRVQPNVLDKSFFVGKDLQDPSDDPEFYTQGTLVDVGYGAEQDGLFTSTYAQQTSRIKWEITEGSLIARLTHERIDNSDEKGVRADLKNQGQIVASYKIEKHFDIQRQYNPSTGEEINVIDENTTDRPWMKRQYFRVDWSKNEAKDGYDFDTLAMIGLFGGVEYTPLAYNITDPNHPDAPKFDLEHGYFDVTNRVFAEPRQIDLRHLGWGIDSFPACMLPADFLGGTQPTGNCNSTELTIRYSFRRIENTDYEPVDWDGHRFRAFGAFTAERLGYSRKYGMTDDKWHRFIARYNIWERSHYYANPKDFTGAIECYTDNTVDPNADADGDGTADACAGVTAATGVQGSQCDVFNQKCTLPYRLRTLKPIAWYYTEGSNLEYFDPSQWATHEWDVAMRSAATTAQYTECVATGGSTTDCRDEFPVLTGQQIDNDNAIVLSREVDLCRVSGKAESECQNLADSMGAELGFSPQVIKLAKMPEQIVLCHSPVEANDPAACGGPRLPANVTAEACAEARESGKTLAACDKALSVRIGDLRYHQINVIKAPQTPSPWGIMVDAEDPLTGEKVSASINVWSHASDSISQSIVDTARYIKGELTDKDITDGTYVGDWITAAKAVSEGAGFAPKMTASDVEKRVADFVQVDVSKLRQIENSALASDRNLRSSARALAQEFRADVMADAYAASTNAPYYEARRQRAMGTDVEAKLTNLQMLQLAGTADKSLTPDANIALSSPLRANNPIVQRDLRRMKEMALAERNACMISMAEAPAPVATANIANLLEEKFGKFNANDDKATQIARAERMRRYVARMMHYNVIAHEAGHSVGLRHNFVSSSDAWGYRPQYWQLRTHNGQQTEACTDFDPTGACVGPRYFDPITPEESENFIQMFMQSTVMDYAGEYTQDMIGLGAYDFAAMRMFYGNAMPVHADPSYNVMTPRGTGMIEKADNFGGTVGFQYSVGGDTSPAAGTDIHYSQLQNAFQLIKDCSDLPEGQLEKFKPSNWNEEIDGVWHPTYDGKLVPVGGNFSRCKQQEVDFVPFQSLRPAVVNRESGFNREGPTVDPKGRTRVPYGFATDRWADLGNLSVYRHDNGADAYELFDFFITQQEMNHIFDNYRRNRTTFSVKNAAFRTLSRFNEKMRDGAKGLGLLANIYRDFALDNGYDYNTLWPFLARENFGTNIMASALAFDHFTRQLARPEPGPHYLPMRNLVPAADGVLRSELDTVSNPGLTRVIVPNGATGLFGSNVTYGGKLVENTLAEDRDKGEYSSEYTINAGSYYDKIFTPMLMTESYDNFISDSRRDFVDPRYRAVSMADLFPEGFRRWLANNLTGDDQIKGVRIAASPTGSPETESKTKFPKRGIATTQWWRNEGPRVCFSSNNLGVPGTAPAGQYAEYVECDAEPVGTAVLDPQVGWEQQKFLIASTLMYLPENQKQYWLNRMWVWELGTDNDPGFANRIEFHDPEGRTYVAKTFGKEQIFSKTVQKGISARVLEYANELLAKGYIVQAVDNNGDGEADWYEPVLNSRHEPVVRFDPVIAGIGPGGEIVRDLEGCNADLVTRYENGDATALDEMTCTCEQNLACSELRNYTAVPYFLREAVGAFGMGGPGMRGIY